MQSKLAVIYTCVPILVLKNKLIGAKLTYSTGYSTTWLFNEGELNCSRERLALL